LSSKAKPRRLIRSGAFLVGALILAGSFPAYAAPDNEAEDWIQETGYGQSSSGASRAKRIADDILRESEKLRFQKNLLKIATMVKELRRSCLMFLPAQTQAPPRRLAQRFSLQMQALARVQFHSSKVK
jgi:hypothetical protein